MYKKCAFFLALLASMAAYATTGPVLSALETAAEGPLQRLFMPSNEHCRGQLSAQELATDSLLHNFYVELDYQPQWQSLERRQALQAQLDELANDGLDPRHYALPQGETNDCMELVISRQYLQALSHLSRGKVEQDKVDRFWRDPNSHSADPRPSVLSLASTGLDDLPRAFATARPQSTQYARLRQAYVDLRGQALDELPPIAAGPSLRPGMHDARVPQLRQRLNSQGYVTELASDEVSAIYDPSLVAAVEQFQARHKLQTDGIVGPATLAALNIDNRQRLAQLRANLERWRWLEGDIENNSLLVDIVGSTLILYKDGVPIWHTRTQVGRPNRQTPRMKSLINQLTLNPSWTVPPTILRQDKLPEIRRDPSFVARNNMRLLDRQGNTLDPYNVDWSQPVMLRQAPGPSNPLGKLVIRFPNPFSVYLHDTPSQHLFNRDARAVSSGCVRVEGIQNLLPLMFSEEQSHAISQKIAKGRSEQVRYEPRLAVLLAYWTADVSDDGQLVIRSDPYKLDPALLRALDTAPAELTVQIAEARQIEASSSRNPVIEQQSTASQPQARL